MARFAVEMPPPAAYAISNMRRAILGVFLRSLPGEIAWLIAFLLCVSGIGFAQTDPAAGIQAFSTNNFGIDLASSNINVSIPLRSKPTIAVSLVGNFHAYLNQNGIITTNPGLLAVGSGTSGRVSTQQELFAAEAEHVWQRRFYDFNVWSERKRVEKLRYMHRNPVERGLVSEPEQWA